MKTAKHILNLLSLIVVNLGYAQYYLPYNPSNWEFMNNASLVDFSQVKSVTTKHLTLDENEEFPVYETFMLWNNSNQLIDTNLSITTIVMSIMIYILSMLIPMAPN